MRYIYCFLLLSAALAGNVNTAHAQEPAADTQLHVTMRPVDITAARDWANDTVRYRYNQMKYYVTTVMPYVHEAVAMYDELEQKTNDGTLSKRGRKDFIKGKEDELKDKFDTEIKKLNETQGVLMVKLIARQTGMNIYDMLLEYKNPIAATKWLGWGRIHGFNLNRKYDPDNEIMLENIMEELGYPLPGFYEEKQILTAN